MKGADLKKLRASQEWSQTKLADLLNQSLDRKYSSANISRWEQDKIPVPKHVAAFLESLELTPQDYTGPTEYEDPAPDFPYPGETGGDTQPPPPPGAGLGDEQKAAYPLPIGSGPYAKVCEELFELVATAVGMVGAVTGNDKLRIDGEIILADKKNLGKAYGKLAETNPTFQRMLTGMTSSGAVLEVALVSGITFGKVMRNHQRPASIDAPDAPVPDPGTPEGMLHVVSAG